MSRWIAVIALISLVGVDRAQAQTQESAPGPGTFEITIHDGRVVQIQRKERFRFAPESSDPKPRD